MTIKEIIDEAYETLIEKGFANQGRSYKEALMLIISELGEAAEAHRKDKRCTPEMMETYESVKNSLASSKAFEKNIKDTFEDELADTVIRICNYTKEFPKIIPEKELKHNLSITDRAGVEQYSSKFMDIDVGNCIKAMVESRDMPMCTVVVKLFDISRDIIKSASYGEFTTASMRIFSSVIAIMELAAQENIDLDKHIRYKMDYNNTRPYLHGKKY